MIPLNRIAVPASQIITKRMNKFEWQSRAVATQLHSSLRMRRLDLDLVHYVIIAQSMAGKLRAVDGKWEQSHRGIVCLRACVCMSGRVETKSIRLAIASLIGYKVSEKFR